MKNADVILDAGDSDIFFRRNGTVFVKTQMGMSGNANLTRQYYQQGGLELDAAGNITLDASGDIILDAEFLMTSSLRMVLAVMKYPIILVIMVHIQYLHLPT